MQVKAKYYLRIKGKIVKPGDIITVEDSQAEELAKSKIVEKTGKK